MFYEEKVIDGVLHSRSTPDGEWIPFLIQSLTTAFIAERGRANDLARDLNTANHKLSEIKRALL